MSTSDDDKTKVSRDHEIAGSAALAAVMTLRMYISGPTARAKLQTAALLVLSASEDLMGSRGEAIALLRAEVRRVEEAIAARRAEDHADN
jgi:hypothetical protein